AERDDADERRLDQEGADVVLAREPGRERARDREEEEGAEVGEDDAAVPGETAEHERPAHTIPLRRTYSSISEFASTARMRSRPVRTGVQNDEMPSVKITLAISVRMNA